MLSSRIYEEKTQFLIGAFVSMELGIRTTFFARYGERCSIGGSVGLFHIVNRSVMSSSLPSTLRQGLSSERLVETQLWWEGLSNEEQGELHWLCHREQVRIARTVSKEGGVLRWEKLPIWLEGKAMEQAEIEDEQLAFQTLYEFITNHEDIQFFLAERHFHICRSHFQAREVLRKGVLPVDFACPLRDRNCPMRAIGDAAGKTSVVFQICSKSRANWNDLLAKKCDTGV
jgi:hypothetical protein